ncbi:MAG: tRNA (uridine(34)/cytosine(34)/5-carboxymethylaminomethyluridine(34)-2'-O)-methyltransferase TrmL [Halofilum sp. (in: g-proteobacteria)]|nr:tRNA (uridine(34)/cytosine(34)/5-carboxymethylaminomethyluridine(34)-2'-O)-methyltransferase TrmL [Halofilum sp. (in: g-proteobacteria)]
MNLPAVVLFRPEIPPNSGNIIRLCANTGAPLHLVHPLGFTIDDRHLRRAGLDYAEAARITHHDSLHEFLANERPDRLFAFTTRGDVNHCAVDWRATDAMLFGPETHGLPPAILEQVPAPQRVRLPMRAGSRSMNLANAVAVAVYEAWRQAGFSGCGFSRAE